MTGAEEVLELRIIFAVLVAVADEHTYGSAGAFSFKDSGKDLHCVAFFAERGTRRFIPRATPVKFALDKFKVDFHTGGHPVDHSADGGTVGFPEGGDFEKSSESVAAHFSIIPFSKRSSHSFFAFSAGEFVF